MSTKPLTTTNIRIIPRDEDFLDRKLGSRGEIFFDRNSNTLRLFDGATTGGISLAKTDLSNISNSVFAAKMAASGVSGGSGLFQLDVAADDSTSRTITGGNTLQFTGGSGISTASTADGEIIITNTQTNFRILAVTGQTSVTPTTSNDTLNFIAGSNVTLTTNAATKSITISADGGTEASDSFTNIAVTGQDPVVAATSADTLNLSAGSGISITTNAGTKTVTVTNTFSPVTHFSFLQDASDAELTIDQIYLPAITKLRVTNIGASAYNFDQYSGNNPTIYAISGTTIAFHLNATGHPFLIQTGAGSNYSTGLFHVSTDGLVSTGVSALGKDSGTLYWKIPEGISGGYRYQCANHVGMVGSILIKSFALL